VNIGGIPHSAVLISLVLRWDHRTRAEHLRVRVGILKQRCSLRQRARKRALSRAIRTSPLGVILTEFGIKPDLPPPPNINRNIGRGR
jgi:hypothetical protein